MLCRPNVTRVLGLALFTAAAALFAGCASDHGQGQKVVEGFQQTQSDLNNAQQQVDSTLAALNVVQNAKGVENLNAAFNSYREQVQKLEKDGSAAKERARNMREQVNQNIWTWQKDMESVSDPTVKASLEARKEAVKTNFAQAQMYADDVRAAYEPFLQENKDIVKALSMSLSPGALPGLAPAMDKTRADGQALKQKIAAMQKALNNIEHGEAPIGKSPSAA